MSKRKVHSILKRKNIEKMPILPNLKSWKNLNIKKKKQNSIINPPAYHLASRELIYSKPCFLYTPISHAKMPYNLKLNPRCYIILSINIS